MQIHNNIDTDADRIGAESPIGAQIVNYSILEVVQDTKNLQPKRTARNMQPSFLIRGKIGVVKSGMFQTR